MNKTWIIILSILGGLIFLGMSVAGFLIGNYNSLISSKTDVEKERAQIETQLQRRFDLVPSLVSSVRGSMKQEQAVFGAIAEARTRYASTEPNTSERVEAGAQYESALSRLLVVMENYPQLQSIDTVKDLMTQIEGTENRVSVARTRYNEVVLVHNKKVRSFPTNILAGFFRIKEEPMFDAVAESDTAPKVDFEDINQ